jgi:hypothetical protein
MGRILLLFISIFISVSLHAKPIKKESALIVGRNFLQSTSESLIMVHTEQAKFLPDTTAIALYYIFNDLNNHSFVIVAGDDASSPILGYSKESIFDTKDIGSNVAKWLEGYEQELRFIITKNIPTTDEIQFEWNYLLNGPTMIALQGETVSPLLKTKWNQGTYYNTLCPYDYSLSRRSVTGCVATAMAQILKYWNHPVKGVGSHSYVHPTYGALSANYSITNYNWTNMPNQLTTSNNDVATLMYHCGVSVNMDYSPDVSGAWVISQASQIKNCSEFAFKEYFDYSESTIGLRRSQYSESVWIQMLKDELDNKRPIMYAGYGSGGGHAFVCDGYDVGNFFHFNWGWGGVYDGYFKINSLNPGAGGTGGGSGSYNQSQQAIFNLSPKPKSNLPTMGIEFYSALTVSPSPILVGGSYTMNFNVVNKDATPFKGDIIGVLVDEDYDIANITTYYTEVNGLPYNYNYTQERSFSGTLSDTVLPGNYYAVILAKPLGGTWEVINNGNFANFVPVTVTTENNIVMYKPFSINPKVITENKSVSVNFDVLNEGSDFTGTFSLDLHTAEGAWIKTIGELTNESLKNNYHYTNGLTFNSNNAFGVPAGTYQLVAWSKPVGGEWDMVKSSGQNYNPVTIIISKPEMIADQFESNNSKVTATRIPYSSQQEYSYSTAYTSIHNTADIDYYKIDLPAGSSYFIDARTQDSYENSNSRTYTLDVMWNYSVGNLTSDSYDDVNTDGSIVVEGGQTIYFAVYPFFQGKTGTYDFEIQISKSVPKDIYEDNNTIVSSYSIDGSFVGITKNIKLSGASIHSTSDIDYYKVTCPTGFIYQIVPFARDKNYLNNASYTLDCEWSYSTNGSTWSSWMDGALVGMESITMNGNGTLFIKVKAKNSGDLGSYAFEMDIAKSMSKDNYETNDMQSNSSILFASFMNNNAIVTTQSASIHTPTDADYYKIDFPSGYSYSIDNFMSDLVASNDGKSYTVDAKFAISTNGTQWTSYYENAYNGLKITADKPTTVYIKVLPSKINTIGTYRYSANITRSVLTDIDEDDNLTYTIKKLGNGFTVNSKANKAIESISVYSNDGKLYSESFDIQNGFSVYDLPSGLYHVYIRTRDGQYAVEKFMSVQ